MWISEPMPVTTRIITADSGSRRNASVDREVARRDPGEDASASIARTARRCPSSCHTAATDDGERRRASPAQATPPETALRQAPPEEGVDQEADERKQRNQSEHGIDRSPLTTSGS